MRKLYHPDKYEVVLGQGKDSALATCWTDPFALVERYPVLKKRFALIGSLYGKEGVSVMLRNLCLNPDIRRLFVLSDSTLSRTAFGSLGWKTLFSLWKNGIDEECRVREEQSQLHHELDPAIIRKVLEHVELVPLSSKELEKFESAEAGEHGDEHGDEQGGGEEPYMEPCEFPEPKRESLKMFPSEEVGFTMRGKSVVDAWLQVVRHIMRYGHIKGTEYGNQQRELHLVTWVIEGEDLKNPHIPQWNEETLQLTGLNAESIKEYQKALLDPKVPEGTTYTYGQRLRAYDGHVDQIEGIIAKLKENPLSRRAFATPFYPISDLQQKYPPCLVQIHVLTNGHKVNMLATFRSHDIFKAAIANAFGLLGLQRYIVEKTGLEMGKLAITSNSAHIYEEEWLAAADLIALKQEKGFAADPRGNILIRVTDNIHLELTEGSKILFEAEGKRAYPLAMKIAREGFLLAPGHYVDIMHELVKAEIALKKGLRYVQDKPLEFDAVRL